jgi:DNA (cytosine-5)-methyltransferase 1
MRMVDLFAGLGGFNLAASGVGVQCVFASEKDERLRSLYGLNFGIEAEGDIRGVSVKDIPGHDLLCAGFPCQPFSKAGDQAGWEDPDRGSVFDRVIEILTEHGPEFVILENVAHFVNHDGGITYQKVKGSLESLGYEVRERKLSPHQFGVAHFRERLFVVARLGGLQGFEWPDPTTAGSDLSIRDVLDRDPPDALRLSDRVTRCLGTWQEFLQAVPPTAKLPSFPIWAMEFGATYPYDCDSLGLVPLARLRSCNGSFGEPLSYRLRREIMENVPSHARAGGVAFPRWKQEFIRQNREFFLAHQSDISPLLPRIREFPSSLQKLEWNCQGEERDIWRYVIQFRASGVRVKRPSTAPSLVAMTATQVPIIGWERRYMTVRECARLQSMEDLKHLPGGERGTSALGNAVNVKVVRLILERLLRLRAIRLPVSGHRIAKSPGSLGAGTTIPLHMQVDREAS